MPSKISIIIPIYNEQENVFHTFARVNEVLQKDFSSLAHEIIFIDDGSADNSCKSLTELKNKHPHIKIIELSRNFGQHIAIKAGLDHATGDFISIMDADLQDNPHDLRLFYEKIQKGYDVVMAARNNRQDRFLKKIFSRIFFKTMNKLSHIQMLENQAMLRLFNKKVLMVLQEMNELHQNNGAFMAWIGFKKAYLSINHEQRKYGKSKYNLRKSIKFAMETIINFSNTPLIYISYLGIIISIFSIVLAIYFIFAKLFNYAGVSGWTSLIVTIMFLGGITIFSLGIVGLYVGKIYQQSLNRPLYTIRNKIE